MMLFLKYEDGLWEKLGNIKTELDIIYWIDKRIEKTHSFAIEGWLANEQIDVSKFVEDYHKRRDEYLKDQKEANDR